jgi:hypothetical protein
MWIKQLRHVTQVRNTESAKSAEKEIPYEKSCNYYRHGVERIACVC